MHLRPSPLLFLLLVLNLLAQLPGEDSTDTEAGGEQHQHVGEEGPRLCCGPDQLGVEPALPGGGVCVQLLAQGRTHKHNLQEKVSLSTFYTTHDRLWNCQYVNIYFCTHNV